MGLLREIPVGYAAGNWYLRLYEDAVSQSIENNTSTLTLRLTLRADRSTWVEFDRRDAWIGGSHFAIAYHHSNGEHELGSTTFPIRHNDDGTMSYDIDFGISTSYALNGSGNGGRTLPTIPRASSFTISGNTLGSPVTVNISRASSSFTHTIRYGFGNIQRDYTGISTSHTFTPPLDDALQIPNAVSGTGGITVYTYSGGTYIGSKSSSLTLSLSGNYGPSYSSLSIARIDNGVPASWNIYVQGKSKATLTINGAIGIYGSSISGYSISGGGYSSTSSSYSTGVLGAGDITFTGTISDSRGRSVSKTTTIKVYECSAPSLQLKAERCTSKGTLDNFGTYVKITPTYTYASVNGKNAITSKSFAITGTSYKNTTCASGASVILGNNDIAIAKSYEVTGVVSDALSQSSSTIKITIPSSSVPLNIRDDARGIGLGKYGEVQDAVDCAWNMKVAGNVSASTLSTTGKMTASSAQVTGEMVANTMKTNGLTCNGELVTNSVRANNITSNGGMTCGDTVYAPGFIELSAKVPYIDFHYNYSTADFHYRIVDYGQGLEFSGAPNGGGTVTLFCEGGGEYRTIFKPREPGGAYLGSDGWRWNTLFVTNSIVQSDLKDKENISTIPNVKDFIMGLNPIMYSLKDGDSNGKRKHLGFGAQEVAALVKELEIGDLALYRAAVKDDVTGLETRFEEGVEDENLIWGLNYNEFIPVAIQGLQMQQEEINTLSKRIDALEKFIFTLNKSEVI